MTRVDLTVLTLSTGGHEQDVQAMLELYNYLIDHTNQKTTKTDQEKGASDQEKNSSVQFADEKHKIYQLITANPQITRAEIAKVIGIHDSSVKRRLESLITDGLIRRVSSTKGGHWEILNLESL